MITHKDSTEMIQTLHKPINPNLIDFYQVMKFCGEEIDSLNFETESYRYCELNSLWWDAMEKYTRGYQNRRMN